MQTTLEIRDDLFRMLLAVDDVQVLRKIQEYARQFRVEDDESISIAPPKSANKEATSVKEVMLRRALQSEADFAAGRVHTQEEVEKEFGL